MGVYQTLWNKQKVSAVCYFNKETDCVLQWDQTLATNLTTKRSLQTYFVCRGLLWKFKGIANNFKLNCTLVHVIKHFTYYNVYLFWWNCTIEIYVYYVHYKYTTI